MAPEETHDKGTKCFKMVTVSLADFLGSASAPQHHSAPKPKKRGTQPQKNCPQRRQAMDSREAEKNINTVKKCHLQES